MGWINQNKILFIRLASYYSEENSHPENCMMPVEMAIMASMAKEANVPFEILDTEARDIAVDDLAIKIRSYNPSIIVLKSKSPSRDFVCNFFSQFNDIIIMGYGHAFTTNADLYFSKLPNLKIVLHREPEMPFSDVIKSLKDDLPLVHIEGISFRDSLGKTQHNLERPPISDLDLLPIASFEKFIDKNYYSHYPTKLFTKKRMAFVLSSRGCPMKCIFCSPTLRQSFGSSMRYQSINRVIEEFTYLKKLGINIVYFRDDILTIDKKRTLSLCHALIKSNVKLQWMGQTHINCIDIETLDAMKEAGCISLGFGIESGSPRIQSVLKKYNDLDHAVKIFKHCRKIGIKTVAFFQVGSPTETYEEVELTRKLLRALNPNLIQVALFTPYAGSAYYNTVVEQDPNFRESNFHHYNRSNHNPSKIKDKDLVRLQKSLYRTFLLKPKNIFLLALDVIVNGPLNIHIYANLYLKSFKYFFIHNDAQKN